MDPKALTKAERKLQLQVHEAMERGRRQAELASPYFAPEIYGAQYFPTSKVATLAVSRKLVIGYNPEFVAKIYDRGNNNGLAKIGGAIWHEIQHPMRRHHDRLLDLSPEMSNIAKDLAINTHATDLHPHLDVSMGLLPSTFGFPEKLTAEEYADLLAKSTMEMPANGACSGGSGSSGEGGWEADIPPGMGRTEVEANIIHAQTANLIREASKQAGKIPGSLLDWAVAQLEPAKVNWRTMLKNDLHVSYNTLLREQGGSQRTYSMPHRKTYTRNDGIFYASDATQLPDVYIVLDTSGSMGQYEFGPALRETRGILTALGAPFVWLVQADAAVAEVRRVRTSDLARLQLRGRGGTAFGPAIEHATEKRATLMVYFTDGYGSAPPTPPPFPVIWCLVGRNTTQPAPWGRTIRIED